MSTESSKAEPIVQEVSIEELQFDELNPNQSTERGADMILNSLSDVGFGRSVLLDKNNKLIGGNQTIKAALKTNLKKVRVIETDGTEVIAVKRKDLDLSTDEKARRLSLFDNRASEISLNWNPEVLSELAGSGVNMEEIFTDVELQNLCKELEEEMPDDGDIGLDLGEEEVPQGVKQFNLFISEEIYQQFCDRVDLIMEKRGFESATDLIVNLVMNQE